jgi:hypothetical protein
VYFPGMSSVMLKKPAEVVVRLVETPVLAFVAVTVALGMTAPFVSVTVPSMAPPAWAADCTAAHPRQRNIPRKIVAALAQLPPRFRCKFEVSTASLFFMRPPRVPPRVNPGCETNDKGCESSYNPGFPAAELAARNRTIWVR